MVATFTQARDDILTQFRTTWNADTPAVNGGKIPQVFYEGVAEEDALPQDDAWARIVIRHTLANQSSLSDDSGQRRFEKIGIVTVQVFTPLKDGKGTELGEGLAQVAKKAYEGKHTLTSNVWFRNVRINEIGVDGPWFQMNVLADFIYDELV